MSESPAVNGKSQDESSPPNGKTETQAAGPQLNNKISDHTNQKCDDCELLSVFVLHRHSIRSPTYYPPNNSHVNSDLYPRGAGYLTDQGIQKCLEVGQIWKSWYPNHINGSDHRNVFVRSSESPRCSETIQGILHSIFSENGKLNPIPVYSPPPGYDKYVSTSGFHADLNIEFKKHYSKALPEHTIKDKQSPATIGQLVGLIKESFNDPHINEYDAFVYIDGFTSNIYEKLPLPDFYLNNEAAIQYLYKYAYDVVIEQFRPFYGYHLLRGMAQRMKQVYEGDVPFGRKWNAFSFHDFSVTAVLNALDSQYEKVKPNFLGAIFFELWTCKRTGKQVVELNYTSGLDKDGTYAEKKALPLQWNDNSNRVEFSELYTRMFDNVYHEIMSNLRNQKYTMDNAMV